MIISSDQSGGGDDVTSFYCIYWTLVQFLMIQWLWMTHKTYYKWAKTTFMQRAWNNATWLLLITVIKIICMFVLGQNGNEIINKVRRGERWATKSTMMDCTRHSMGSERIRAILCTNSYYVTQIDFCLQTFKSHLFSEGRPDTKVHQRVMAGRPWSKSSSFWEHSSWLRLRRWRSENKVSAPPVTKFNLRRDSETCVCVRVHTFH